MAKTKQEQQRRLLEYKDFDLIKMKLTDKGVYVEHHENGTEPGTDKRNGEYQPHPDLLNALDALKLYMATRLGLLEGWDFAREHLKNSKNHLKSAIMKHEEVIERMNVNGITYVGEGETRGVMITGSIQTPKGGSTGLAVPKITFGKEVLGYETEVEELCGEIRKETYGYRFQKKKLQEDINT